MERSSSRYDPKEGCLPDLITEVLNFFRLWFHRWLRPYFTRLVTEKNERSDRMEGSSSRYDPKEGSSQDPITEDGILCSILSHLSLREAVATSVLSPRWRQLWTNRHKLCFSIDTMFDSNTVRLICAEDTPLTHDEIIKLALGKRIQFIEDVNSVVQQLQGRGEIYEFRLRYFLHRKHSHHLDAWVRFALSSNTKVLALYLHKPFHKEPVRRAYEFPFWLLGPPSSLEDLTLQCCSLKPPRKFDGLTNLKILKLYYIDLIEEDITYLLANCRTLEQLMLESSPRLRSLRILHPLSQLNKLVVKHCHHLTEINIAQPLSQLNNLEVQHCHHLREINIAHPLSQLNKLEVQHCHHLREININAVNLRTLFYWGYSSDLMLSQSSRLKDVFILFKTGSSDSTLDFYITQLSRNLPPQLPSLDFRIAGDLGVSKMLKSPRESNRFNSLTCLKWCWNVSVKMSLIDLATLMDAFPILEEFSLTLWRLKCTEEEGEPRPPTENLGKLKKRIPERRHTHLKTIELINFYYETWQIEIALYLFKNAIELESMTIKEEPRGLDETQRKKLTQLAPPNVKLVIPVINV